MSKLIRRLLTSSVLCTVIIAVTSGVAEAKVIFQDLLVTS